VPGGSQDAALTLPNGEWVLDDEDLGRASVRRRAVRRHLDLDGLAPAAARWCVHERSRVDEERDPSVSENRRAEVAIERGEKRAELLDDELLLAEEPVADDGDAPAPRRDDDRRRLVDRRRGSPAE